MNNDQEELPKRSIDVAKDFLDSRGLKFAMKPRSSTMIVLRSEDRVALQKELEKELADLGFEWQPNAPGAEGFGRFAKIDGDLGNAYILMKPKSGGAAGSGLDYEKEIAALMQSIFPTFDVTTAGFGPGSDLEISGDGKDITIELKTKSGADFGQFRTQYDVEEGKWETRKTKNFKKSEVFFQSIFDEVLKPLMDQISLGDLNIPNYNRKHGKIYGLKRGKGTGVIKKELQSGWFGGKADKNLPIDGDLIQSYYASKGDQLIQVRGKGVYALTKEASDYFNIPELKDKIVASYLRFRIKPHGGGADSCHSFTAALKVFLEPSSLFLNSTEILDKLELFLSN